MRVSRGISSPFQFGPARELKNLMLGWLVPIILDAPRVQPFCCESAAFLNESIIREIITGRYLRPAIVSFMRGLWTNVALTRRYRWLQQRRHVERDSI